MLDVPFLTELDSRAAVKGSRDPLGAQQVWTRLGRHVVGNLTTVSNSVRDFTILIIGYYFAEQVAEEIGPGRELDTFLKWEQLAGYARASVNRETGFRGTELVNLRIREGGRVTISADGAHQILGNQKIYGIWGLYTVPGRASGLVDGDPTRLTPAARKHFESVLLPILREGAGKDLSRIRSVLARSSERIDIRGTYENVMKAIGKALQRRLLEPERSFYREHLLYGGPDDTAHEQQERLAALLQETLHLNGFTWSPSILSNLVTAARRHGNDWQPLADRLSQIRVCESVLAPTAALFTYLLGLHDKTIDWIARRLREEWGQGLTTVDPGAFEHLRGDLSGGDSDTGDRWIEIAKTLSAGRYGELLELLAQQNKAVMAARGGAPWVEFRPNGLHVRFQDEHGGLPSRDEIHSLWRYSYFLDSLRGIAGQLENRR